MKALSIDFGAKEVLTKCLLFPVFFASSYAVAEPDETAVARFLTQATLGFTEQHVKNVQETGFSKWIGLQLQAPPTLIEPYIESLSTREKRDRDKPRLSPYHKVNAKHHNVGYRNLNTAWMRAVLSGEDQLRQRVAWALSQIIVSSNSSHRLTEGTSNYYDLLLTHAFSSYEDLLIDVTFHPVMGRYLTYMGNRKSDAKSNRQPDENYAREVMQLFTIGLWQLNSDGSKKTDEAGNFLPTYSNSDITELARVFTGFWLTDTRFGKIDWDQYDEPMSITERQHDKLSKSLLDGYIQTSSMMPPELEVRYTIRKLARHPNVAPFLSRKLINNLVTSNPSRQYIERISTVWQNTNGSLGKVIEAILLDSEARNKSYIDQPHYGRLKDPIQRVTNLLIGFDCGSNLGKKTKDYPGLQWWRPDPFKHLSQAPMQSPSVFNFFEPEYSKPGMIADANLFSPEFQILDDATASTVPNYIWRGLLGGFHKPDPSTNSSPLTCSFDSKLSVAELLRKANLLLAAGNVDTDTLTKIEELIKSQSKQKEKSAVFAIAISPSATIQR